VSKGVRTNRGGQQAWRAPAHPQACFLTMSALEDTAAVLKMDALEFFLKNLQFTKRGEVYAEELKIAADLIGYKQKAHPRGDPNNRPHQARNWHGNAHMGRPRPSVGVRRDD